MFGSRKKLESRKILENGDESPPSSARCVGPPFTEKNYPCNGA
jgi:hypothetical protein